ncbi:MAG TPA: ATP-binding protein, partial [Candidatus Binataceae bacterium]|nr:ATP-binding protein [Candidatus Binataceae bacterium]
VITHINEIAAIILGLDPSEALGNPFDDLSSNHPHYLRIRDALRTLRRTGVESQRVEVELHVRGRDHTYVLKPVPLTHTGDRQLGTLVILQDVTYLRDQDRARVNLVATLSHELRTPLTSLAISADLIRREEAASGGKYEDLVRAILQDCARMRNLVDNLLNLARGEAATIALRRERIDFGRLAEEVSNRFRIQAEAKHVELVKRIEPVPVVLGDPVKLSWVVSNLLGNALRYTPDGGKIEVVARPENGSARLEVADSGPGIEPELRDHIFERFAQYDANGAQKGSAGLGLAIVKDIVEAHGGRIFLDTEVGKGSHFIVDLPASPEA